MFRSLVACTFAVLPLAAQEAAAEPKPKLLQPIDLFRLEYLMVLPAETPVDWLDAERYLVFDAGPKAMPGQGVPRWSAVEARTGKRTPYVDHAALLQGLAGVADAEAALADDEAWIWNEDHTRFVVDVGGDLFAGGLDGKVVRLSQTPDEPEVGVTLSPDGRSVAFIAGHDLHVVAADGGEVRALTEGGNDDLFFGRLDWVYQEELYGRGNFQGYWWSPDSTRIALLRLDEAPVQEFVIVGDWPARPPIERTNYPKVGEPNPIVDVGVIDVATGATRWCDLSAYPAADRLVVRVTWAPDSAEVVFQVQNREQTWLDLLAADAASGAVRKLWREDSDCWVEAGPEPEWLADGAEFLWLSERDGFRHVWRFARSGEPRGRLTEGEWQVKAIVDVDEANGCIHVTADKDSPLQTHLYRVPLAGGPPQRITQGRGTHDVRFAPDHRTFVTTWSDAETPPCTTLRDLDDQVLRAIATSKPQLLARHAPVTPRFVQVPTRDGFPMEAVLLEPRDRAAGKPFPVVQFTYSGPHTPRVRDEWGSRDQLWHQLLVQRGYTVFVCDNRSASGKGRRFARACWRQPGQSELQDLEDSVDWLVAQGADPQRIAIWGWSYGGYQTLYNLTHSTKWQVGIAVNPVTDWRNYDTIYTERYFGLPTTNADGYARGSVVEAAANLHGHLLLLCGAMDDNVHMQNSLQFLHALQQAGKDCDFMVYPRVRHGIEDLQQQLHLWARFERFLAEHL
ncbi:MAG: S9 family peptidase [Planctomycetes bacterium]|nr:S9 family peptidase [Planctomycetota bacterium]